ncbi:NAD-specific glutamate dehydrogenase [Corynebacterium glutamicum MT]|nr:NAD-specific glutamate dehydrogenase [Corynebacterium glutamicum MT]
MLSTISRGCLWIGVFRIPRIVGHSVRGSHLLLILTIVSCVVFDNFSVNNIVICSAFCTCVSLGCTSSSVSLVDSLTHFLGLGVQLLNCSLDCLEVLALECFFNTLGCLFDLCLEVFGDLLGVLFNELAGLVNQGLSVVADFLLLAALLVLISVRFSILDHAINFILGQTGAVLNGDGVFLTSALVLCGDVDDAVSVDVESDLDLWDATWCRCDAAELEGSEQLVGGCDFTLALEDLDLNRRLVVFCGGEGLGTLGWDGGVTLDELGHHPTLGLNAEGQWGDVKKKNILDLATENTSLKCCTNCNYLIWVNTLVWLASTGQFLDQFGNSRHTGGTTDENNVVDLGNGHASVLNNLVERSLGAIQEVLGDALELCTGKGLIQEQWVLVCINGDIRKVDVCTLGRGQLDLCLLSCLTQTLQGHLVLSQVNAVGGLELLYQPVNDTLIPVVATELVVAGGCTNFNNTVTDLQEGDVEGTATEVEYQDGLLLLALLKTVCKCGRGWLVNNTKNVESRDLASFLGCLTLRVLEVCRNGNNSIGNVLAQVRFSVALQLHQGTSRDFL